MPEKAVPQPFLDWFGVWPGQAGRDEKARAWLQDPPQGIGLKVQPARRSEVFMRPPQPWDQNKLSHSFVILEEGRYRLWYHERRGLRDGGVDLDRYAESEDGCNWEFPELGLYEFEGSTANNILCDGDQFHIHSVFRDPIAGPDERYKAIESRGQFFRQGKSVARSQQTKLEIREVRRAMELNGYKPEEIDAEAEIRHLVRAAVSPDGLRWKPLNEPLLDTGHTQLDTQNIAAFDEDTGEYVAFLRGQLDRRRSVRRTGGKAFGNWHPTRLVLTIDSHDEPFDDIYTPAYCRCPGSRRHLMFPTIYHRLSSNLDIQLASSHDGWLWRRTERVPIVTRESGDTEYGAIYASPNLVPLGEEWGIPYMGVYGRHDGGGRFLDKGERPATEYRWALWKPERLVALEAPNEGQFTTTERRCAGLELRLNYQTEQGGWIKVGLAHRPTTPASPLQELEGFGLDQCEVLAGDQVSQVVSWDGNSDLAELEGQQLSVRVRLSRAKLFSIAL